jgi:hypothetical protein
MKKYWIILVLVVIVGISIPVIIVYNAVPHAPKPVMVCLNTDSMQEAGNKYFNRGDWHGVLAAYICNEKKSPTDTIPWADAFVVEFFKDTSSLKADTVVFLDTKPGKWSSDEKFNECMAEIAPAKKFKKCKVLMPQDKRDIFKKYKYTYGNVTLITEY